MKKVKKENLEINVTEEQIDKQEHLSPDRLKLLKSENDWYNDSRPTANLIDLMHWVRCEFGVQLSEDTDNLECFIHNKIVIDGSFLEYAEKHNIKVECLFRDSVASWRHEKKSEHFMAQGIFLITYKDISFIHASLFHKGNQNEDEVSFFIIIEDNNFHKYLTLRDNFDEWLTERDRSQLQVRVIGGESYSYTRDAKWDDIYLPKELKNNIVTSVEGFLKAEKIYKENKIPWRRGILLYGRAGCHAKGTEILMYDGSIKLVEDVIVGDLLMGPDSQPREVMKLVRGNEEMYEIFPAKGKSFIVNKNHQLSLINMGFFLQGTKITVSVEDLYTNNNYGEDEGALSLRNLNLYFLNGKTIKINDIRKTGLGDYYGFTLDKDHLYCTGDQMVHHNCGKSSLIKTIISNYNFKPVAVSSSSHTNDDTVTEAFEYAQEQAPGLLFFEDLDTLLGRQVNLSHFLNLMDGINSKSGILVIATANDISKLAESVTDRPSRFDEKFEIPLPDKQMTYEYLKKWFGESISVESLKKLVKSAVDNKFSYAYLKDIYIRAIFRSIADKRDKLNQKDIDIAIKELLLDKEAVKNNFEVVGNNRSLDIGEEDI